MNDKINEAIDTLYGALSASPCSCTEDKIRQSISILESIKESNTLTLEQITDKLNSFFNEATKADDHGYYLDMLNSFAKEFYCSKIKWMQLSGHDPGYKQNIITYSSQYDDIDKTRYRPDEVDYDFWIPWPEL